MRIPPLVLICASAMLMALTCFMCWDGDADEPSASGVRNSVVEGNAMRVKGANGSLDAGSGMDGREPLDEGRRSLLRAEWSAGSRALLKHLEGMGSSGKADIGGLAKVFLAAVAGLPSDERIRLLKATASWFVAGGHDAHGFMEHLSMGRDRMQFATEMLRVLLPGGSQTAVEWVSGVRDKQDAERLHTQLAREWARDDLEAAVDWAMGLTESGMAAAAMEGVAFTWTQRDVETAFDWAASIADANVQDRVLGMMVKVMALRTPDLAAQWATEIPMSKESSASLNYAVQAWARRDVEGAATWLQSIEDPAHRKTAMRAVAVGWGGGEPAAAAEWVWSWEGVEQREDILGAVVEKWGNVDPAAAMGWIGEHVGNDATWSDAMLRKLFAKTHAEDPTKVQALLEQLGSDDLKAIAMEAIGTTPDDYENKQ